MNNLLEKYKKFDKWKQSWEWEIDHDGVFTYSNERAKDIAGYDADELTGKKTPFDLMPLEEAERIKGIFFELRETQEEVKYFIVFVRHSKGHLVVMELVGVPVCSGAGEFVGYRGLNIDVTERFHVTRELVRQQETFNTAMNAANEGLWECNPITQEVYYYSPRWYTMLGYEPDAFPHSYESWVSLICPEDKERVEFHIRRYLQNKEGRFSVEYRMRKAQGDYCWILTRGEVTAWDEKGVPVRMCGTNVNIDSLKETQSLLIKAQEGLKDQAFRLEQKNIDLTEVLRQIEDEKQRISDNIVTNIRTRVFPYLSKLRAHTSRKEYVDMIENVLKDITTTHGLNIDTLNVNLSPREREICDMVCEGFQSKDIGRLLGISPDTVVKHRKNIRKKLNIPDRKINMASFLRSLSR